MLNALTIDVEEHFQVHAFETVVDRLQWDRYPSRVVGNTQRVLRLLAEHHTHATFFILGWVADRHPELVSEIASRGHEIATHGYWHELIYRQTPGEFASDLAQSLRAIGRALGNPLSAGYRAPAFSITSDSLWALDVLRDHGILYDSSIFPVSVHDRYGLGSAQRFPHRLRNGLWEFPGSTIRLGGFNWPVAGGGYFRLYPLWLTRYAIRHMNHEGHAAVVYLHPWEFDPDQPRIRSASLPSRFRHYVNLRGTESRLRALFQDFQFAPMGEVYANLLK